jgi:NarL family two-component system response regulator LiaR
MSTELIKVVLVDDHNVVRSGLGAFLMVYDDLELAGEASNGKEAVELCLRLQPDVVLMDLVMPEMDGAAATRIIREKCPKTQVIILTSFKEDNLIEDALKAGAIGYLLKNTSAEELAQAIRSAKLGRPTLSPEATQAPINAQASQIRPSI